MPILKHKQRIILNKQRLLNALFVAKGLKMLPHCQNSQILCITSSFKQDHSSGPQEKVFCLRVVHSPSVPPGCLDYEYWWLTVPQRRSNSIASLEKMNQRRPALEEKNTSELYSNGKRNRSKDCLSVNTEFGEDSFGYYGHHYR